MSRCFIIFVLLATDIQQLASLSSSKRFEPTWESLDTRVTPEWYDEGKIGIILHWGVYSVPAYGVPSSWFCGFMRQNGSAQQKYMAKYYKPTFLYADFAKEFTADLFNPEDWVELFEAAGANYVALTTKHHDGYCNWNTKYSFGWNSLDVGSKRDLIGELSEAMYKRDKVRFGIYHSWFEFYNPLYIEDKARNYTTQTFTFSKPLPCLYELVSQYKPQFIWSDGDWEANSTYWNSTTFLAWLFNDSPVKDVVVVNDRWGNDSWCKHGDTFDCMDRFHPKTLQKHKWENTMSLDKEAWGFRRDAKYKDFYSIEELLTELVQTVSCGGNILINVGPRKDGTIPVVMEERLRQMGFWLKVNGKGIYKTVPWKHQNDTVNGDVWYTKQKYGNDVYAFMLKWPENYKLYMFDPVATQDTKVQLLGHRGYLGYVPAQVGQSGLEVSLPLLTPGSELKWVWVLKMSDLANANDRADIETLSEPVAPLQLGPLHQETQPFD